MPIIAHAAHKKHTAIAVRIAEIIFSFIVFISFTSF